ncbi:hypothetical protein GGR52DRAFT_480974 [Hypoxylon sp. FL1284]|nr:hypothetical protein GGR52DRAFT_480974 [Hypoxylon sp. FL1284]
MTYQCLMSDCKENEFNSPQEMLRHLQTCSHFRGEQYRCPTCNVVERLRAAPKRCPFNMVKFSQRFHEKLKELFKGLTSSYSERACPRHPSIAAGFRYELLGESAPGELGSPTEPVTAATSQAGPPPFNYSPVSVSELSQDAPNYCVRPDYLSTIYSQSTERSDSFIGDPIYQDPALDPAIDPVLGGWKYSASPQLQVLSAVPLLPFSNQPGLHGSRGPQLTIDTSHPGPANMQSSACGSGQMDSGDTSWLSDPMDNDDSPFFGVDPSPSFVTCTSPMDWETDVSTFAIEGCSSTQSFYSLESSSPPNPIDQPSSPEPSPSSNYRCSVCGYEPKGKPQNFTAYYRKHMSKHAKKDVFQCEWCPKTFTRRDNMGVHSRKCHLAQTGLNVI